MARWPLDRVLALALLVVLSPVLAAVALVVGATSRGPMFLRVARVGQHGRTFAMWKLRTMRVGPGRVSRGSGGAGGPPLTVAGDSRVTAAGRFLRRHRLDELPQLVNVVMGEMALIGPRPETPEYVEREDPRWQAVLAARPGIAGPTQLVVRSHEPAFLASAGEDGYRTVLLPAKLAIDSWYIRRASPVLDGAVVVGVARSCLGLGRGRLEAWVERSVPEAQPLLVR